MAEASVTYDSTNNMWRVRNKVEAGKQEVASTKKRAVQKARGMVQKYADKDDSMKEVTVYTKAGKHDKFVEVHPV